MNTTVIQKPNERYRYSFHPPDIAPAQWCDFRRDFETGMTFKAIGVKYHCDPRTVRQCILLNKSSSELGRQFAPTRLAAFTEQVSALYQKMSYGADESVGSPDESAGFCISVGSCGESPGSCKSVGSSGESVGITQLSREITRIIREQGYCGSERTVRNHLRKEFFHADHQDHT